MNIKIGVIGAGTASAIGILGLLRSVDARYNNLTIDVTCIHDPLIPITHVGESMSPTISRLLFEVVGFNSCTDMAEIDATHRFATKYFWNSANGNDFFVRYGTPGLHANSEKFSKFVLNKLKLNPRFHIIEDSVIKISNMVNGVVVQCNKDTYQFDLLIDCSGTPSEQELDSDLYATPDVEAVNSVILYQDFNKYNEEYTSSYVHKNGWMFGVPLQHRKAFGYVFNNKITTKDDIKEDFLKTLYSFSLAKDVDVEKCRSFSWKQYYRKNAMDQRILYLGNKLYFFEPHQAIPLHYYFILIENMMGMLSYFQDFDLVANELNKQHIDNIDFIQDLIALNYVGENKLNSKFWNYTKINANNRLKNSEKFKEFITKSQQDNKLGLFWMHSPTMMLEYIQGFKINLDNYV
jgi:Tryptophan halogenase